MPVQLGKKLCGKAIPRSDDTYLTTVKLRDKFIQLKKMLKIRLIPEPDAVVITLASNESS